jgi:hypothetical protein
MQSSGHPGDLTAAVDLNTEVNQSLEEILPGFGLGLAFPVEPVKEILVDAPAGVLGNPTVAATCTATQLVEGESIFPRPLCSEDSQVGTIVLHDNLFGNLEIGPLPLYNMVAPPGVPARFGFAALGTVQTIDAHLRSDGSYGVTTGSRNISEGIALAGNVVDLWGVPADPSHDSERACPGSAAPSEGGPHCPSFRDPRPFLRNTSACTPETHDSVLWSAHVDSWLNPAAQETDGYPDLSDLNWKDASYRSHEAPGYPANPEDPTTPWGAEVGVTGCENVPFEPALEVKPTSKAADSPTGLEVDLSVPQEECWQEVEAICQSDLKKAKVALPEGMTVNSSSAAGLASCSAAQIGLLGSNFEGINPIHFTDAPDSCPPASRIGTVEIQTPLLEEPVNGAVYLAKQGDNPFGSLLGLYVVAENPQAGVLLKLPGRVVADGTTGRLEAVFDYNPQLPFSSLHLELKSGPRAPLINPPACGKYTTEAMLTPWARPTEELPLTSSFEVTQGSGGAPCPSKPASFSPKLSAGTRNPLAGAYSPFSLRLTREDGTQRLADLDVTLAPGLLAKLAGIPYCPDAALAQIPTEEGTGAAQLANPSCPAASQLGTVIAGAGAGPTPFFAQTGKAYLAGPYKGAPLSLAAVTPALAGPFDLGNVVVRNALRVDPETAQAEAVSDPLPRVLHGIPLDLRDVRVILDRNQFTLNPTSCDPMSIDAVIGGTEGASASLADRFQVGECGRLAFKPKLSLRLVGRTTRAGHPALKAVLKMPGGGANIARAQVTLPPSEFIDNAHFNNVCTRVQFAAGNGGGEGCPKGSVYGYARAYSPLLDQPLAGPVYLRTNPQHELPDIVASLGGQIHVDLAGRVDSFHGGIRTTFESVPDAPVSKFVLQMKGGKKSLIENSENLCKRAHRAIALFDGQSEKVSDSRPVVGAKCGGKRGRSGRR